MAEQKITEQKAGYRHIVRVANCDLDGSKSIGNALRKVKGVNFMFANMACSLSGINKFKKTGEMTETETKHLEEVIINPKRFGAPEWMLNRRKDFEDGENRHLLMSTLDFEHENDLKRMKKIRSYKGLRHAWGLPVRGQRTKGNFRKSKGKVMGVQRKKTSSGRV